MDFTLDFLAILFKAVWLSMPLLIFFGAVIALLGQLVGRLERWTTFNSLYWSFITAFTVGYGDIKPSKKLTKTLAIFIALFGIMFTGVVVAVTVAAATAAFEKNVDIEVHSSIQNKTIQNGL